MTIHLKHILLLAAVIAALQGPGLARAENGQIAPPLGAPSGEQSQGERSQRSRSNARPNDPARAVERRPRSEQQPEVRRSRAEQRVPGREASPRKTREERFSQPGVGAEIPRRQGAFERSNAIHTAVANGQPESRNEDRSRHERNDIQKIHGGYASARPRHDQLRHDARNAQGFERGKDHDRHDRDRHDRKQWEENAHDQHDNSRHESSHRDHDRHNWTHRPRHKEQVYHHLPPRHDIFHHRGERYHFYSGRYYCLTSLGFILVRPPVGLVVFSLPIGFQTVISAGFTYYVCGDVYYRRVPAGYEVVKPGRVIDRDYPERVAVDIAVLNVRHGPDDEAKIIAQVAQGRILKVLGAAPGWLYIDAEPIQGWVMEHYVVNVSKGRG